MVAYPSICRRFAATLFLVAVAAVLAVSSAQSETPNPEIADFEQALTFVDHIAAQAFDAMEDRGLTGTQRQERLRTVLDSGFNVRYIALFSLGAYGRGIDEEMLEDYEAIFGDFLFAKYQYLFDEYAGKEFRTLHAERAGRRDVLVHMMVVKPDGGKAHAEWRVRIFDGEPKIIDVNVAGFSLTQSQREEFTVLIKETGINGLMSTLKSRAAARRA